MRKLTLLEYRCLDLSAAAGLHLERTVSATAAGLETVQQIMLTAKSKKQRTFPLSPTLPFSSDAGDWHDVITGLTVDSAEFLGELAVTLEQGDFLPIDDLPISDRYDILQQFVNRRFKLPIT